MTDLMKSRRFDMPQTGDMVTLETAFTTLVTVNWEANVSNPSTLEPKRFRMIFPTTHGATEWVNSAHADPNAIGSPTQNLARRASVLRCTMAQLQEWEPVIEIGQVQQGPLPQEEEPLEETVLAADEPEDEEFLEEEEGDVYEDEHLFDENEEEEEEEEEEEPE